jgi:hypothetical protein
VTYAACAYRQDPIVRCYRNHAFLCDLYKENRKPLGNLFPAKHLDAHMAHALNTHNFTFDLTSRFRAMIADFRAARARRAAFNTAYAELQQLSSQELMEFGLHRSDLVEMARVEAYRG